ncbi:MAG: hypothetical protein ACOZBL_05650 [Patescibacteria group bacterium]
MGQLLLVDDDEGDEHIERLEIVDDHDDEPDSDELLLQYESELHDNDMMDDIVVHQIGILDHDDEEHDEFDEV